MNKAYNAELAMDAWTVNNSPNAIALAQKTIDEIVTCNRDSTNGLCGQDMCDLKNAAMAIYYLKATAKLIEKSHAGCACTTKMAHKPMTTHMHENGATRT